MIFFVQFCLCSIIITILSNAFPQINFHQTTFEQNCLRISIPELADSKDTQEILSFCLTQPIPKSSNTTDPKFTFNDLRKLNITTENLYRWSAPIDLLEQYEEYLIFNHSLLSNVVFYNCTPPRFGQQCQFEFISAPSQHLLTLQEIVIDFYSTDSYVPATSLTCYMHLECDRGSKLICLDWTEICDGIVHCLNDQIDEKLCWQLEINECRDDEYRCANGQCISKQFTIGNTNLFECLFELEFIREFISNNYVSLKLPMIYFEDRICSKLYDTEMWYLSSSCHVERRDILNQRIFNSKSNTVSNICYLATVCTLYSEKINSLICKDICSFNRCLSIINATCSQIIIPLSMPIIYGHIYAGYHQPIDQYSVWNVSQIVCFDERFCKNFRYNSTKIIFHNKTCHRLQNPSEIFNEIGKYGKTLHKQFHSFYRKLSSCNTILYDNFNGCNSSFMYHCQNSSKCITSNRLCDGIIDCDYNDDEYCPLINGSCLPMDSNLLYKCPFNNKCISNNKFGNRVCDCPLKESMISHSITELVCEDEPYYLCDPNKLDLCAYIWRNSYKRTSILFSTICDGYQELLPIRINGIDHTDETECQYWQCDNIYTHCNGYWNCLDGADEVDCTSNTIITCSLQHHLCIKPTTFEFQCLPLAEANDGRIDCLGATDEPTKCRSNYLDIDMMNNFYCNKNKSCIRANQLCISDCIDQQDLFCKKLNKSNQILCNNHPNEQTTKWSQHLCSLPIDRYKNDIVYFSLEQLSSKKPIQLLKTILQRSSVEQLSKYNGQCHRGFPLRTLNTIVCLCPSSYYGQYCQYQNQRVSFTLKFQTYADSRRTLFSIVIQLVDNSSQRIIHSSKQLTFVQSKNCDTKFNFHLTYANRPKNTSQTHFIHIDIYEKSTLGYRGSLYIPLQFSFLPVHRISYVLTIPRNNQSAQTTCSKTRSCINGQCMKYAEDSSSNRKFCHCNPGWTGVDCSILYNCSCASHLSCAGVEANNRSICICPPDKWGPRCLLSNTACQFNNNSTCLNNGQYVLTEDKFFCICPKGFSGDRCELEDVKIILSFDENIILSDFMLVHLIEIQKEASVRNGSTFQSIPLYQREITVRWAQPFHIVFIELLKKTYYLVSVQKNYNRSQIIRKLMTTSDRCNHVSEYVNETIVNYPLIRRIKYYHLPCQNKTISCFYDRDHFCLCNDFGSQRVANCFEFDSTRTHNCFKLSMCQNGGQCLQDDVQCPQTFQCVCRECFYGSLCQFSSSSFDISLDGIIGSHIQPNLSLTYQPPIIKITLTLLIIMIIVGLINGILSFFAFRSKEARQVGCGYYLLGSAITTLLTSLMLALKFSILLCAQMSIITNEIFLNLQCYSFDYLLLVCLNMDRWLNACVAIDRALNVFKGTHFDKKKSKQIAKYMISCLVVFIMISTIYDPIHRQLVNDDSNDEHRRVWCIVSYSSQLLSINQSIHMFHFFVPFLINIISSLIIIILSTKRQQTIRHDQSYFQIFYKQVQQHRHLLVSSLLLVLLSLPRLIISFVAGCVQSNSSPWIYLIGYLVSFVPPMLTFVIFVSPSKLYKEEFRKTVKRYQKTILSDLLNVKIK